MKKLGFLQFSTELLRAAWNALTSGRIGLLSFRVLLALLEQQKSREFRPDSVFDLASLRRATGEKRLTRIRASLTELHRHGILIEPWTPDQVRPRTGNSPHFIKLPRVLARFLAQNPEGWRRAQFAAIFAVLEGMFFGELRIPNTASTYQVSPSGLKKAIRGFEARGLVRRGEGGRFSVEIVDPLPEFLQGVPATATLPDHVITPKPTTIVTRNDHDKDPKRHVSDPKPSHEQEHRPRYGPETATLVAQNRPRCYPETPPYKKDHKTKTTTTKKSPSANAPPGGGGEVRRYGQPRREARSWNEADLLDLDLLRTAHEDSERRAEPFWKTIAAALHGSSEKQIKNPGAFLRNFLQGGSAYPGSRTEELARQAENGEISLEEALRSIRSPAKSRPSTSAGDSALPFVSVQCPRCRDFMSARPNKTALCPRCKAPLTLPDPNEGSERQTDASPRHGSVSGRLDTEMGSLC